MEAKILYIKKVIDGKVVSFPSEANPAVISTYTYDAKRMGGTPTITATILYERPLDDDWNKEEYVDFNGEKYHITSTPSSNKSSDSLMYKHGATFTSGREVLDNTLFFDVVVTNLQTQSNDRYRSNKSDFTFGGNIREFVDRINSSLAYSNIYRPNSSDKGYYVVIDEGFGIDDVKELSFSDRYITEVLQLINTEYGLEYYWVGSVCHIGKCQHDLTTKEYPVLRYGRNDALLSIGRENTNSKVVDMVTGYGSSDNIQYYYPNDSEYGEAIFDVSNVKKEAVSINLGVLLSKYPNPYGTRFTLCKNKEQTYTGQTQVQTADSVDVDVEENDRQDMTKEGTIEQSFTFPMRKGNRLDLTNINVRCTYNALSNGFHAESIIGYKLTNPSKVEESKNKLDSTFVADRDGIYTFTAIAKYTAMYRGDEGGTGQAQGRITLSISGIANIIYTPNAEYVFACGDKNIAYDGSGIVLENHEGLPHWECGFSYDPETGWYADDIDQIMDAASVTITDRLWLEPTGVLMPSIYRATGGANRFYYAKNNTHIKPDGSGEYYEFKNIYNSNSPHQGSYTHDDIKPTIRGIRNDVIQADGLGQLFGEIADVAFDKEDSDMVDSNGNYIHSYFYIKLHKFSGDYGFSLFDNALSTENAKIEMIECQGCPACSFTIGCHWVNEENKCYNIVLTDGNGNLMSESDKMNSTGDYILNNTYVKDNKSNQDSTKEELWICVQKDNSTLGVVMPNASAGFKPKKGDKFVITGIKPPKALTLAAEKRLEEALIKDMYNDNEDKFNYPIKFSRIFLQENPDFASKLNENSRVAVEYNGHKVELFTSNYSVKVDENALASVEVELVKSLDITESSIKQAIEAATNNSPIIIGSQGNGGLQGGDGGAYLSKVSSDTAHGFIKFLQGLQVGSPFISGLLGTGGVFRKDADGKTYIEVDKIYARVKAIFDNVEIRNFQHMSGNRIVSVAGMNIVRVENVDANGNVIGDNDNTGAITTAYRCYFRGKDGDNLRTNDFVVGDLAFCSRTSVDVALTHKRYWRAVIRKSNEVDVNGNHWIDLSVDDCEKDSDIPSVGDDVSQLGNKTKIERQGVIIEMSSGEEAPCYQIFQGINDYTLEKKCMIDLGYNSTTGRAKMNVYGDAYIGDIDGNSFIRYDSLGKTLEIKAKIDAKSTIGDRDIDKYIKDNTLSSDDVKNLINSSEIIGSLQNQIDGAIETWYYEGKPTLENLPAQGWTDDETKNRHIGDLYYDKASGKGYRFLKDSTNTYTWAIITDEDITKALALAGEKKRIFGTTPTPPYDVDDLWVYAVYPSDGSKYNKDILRCITAKSAGEKFSIDDWTLASDYATNTKVAQLDYLKDALKNDTVVNGGLILSTLIALRDKSQNIQSGINGAVQDAKYKGGGIAAWYGGEMGDIEDKSNYPGVTNWAKSLLRFDGSGYLANGNISWGSEGKVSIKDLSALINTDKTDILNVLSSISSMFSTRVKESEVLILPQLRFGNLFIERLRQEDLDNNDVVLTQGELKDRFVTIDWFNKVFSVVDDKKSDLPVNGNISSGASIRAKMSLWSDRGISALGNSASSGGSGGGGGLDEEMLWSVLGNSGTEQISKSHLADALAGYATEDWVEGKGYLTAHQDISGKADRSELLGYLPLSGGTLSGTLTASKGLVVQGRAYGGGDDEGIVIEGMPNGLAGVIFGNHTGDRGLIYFHTVTHDYSLQLVLNGVRKSILIPFLDGTLALTSQIPTNNNQLTNGAGYITSSGSCAYATNADTVDGVHVIYRGSIPDSNWLAAWENATTIRCLAPKSLKLSRFSDDILSGKYLPLTGGILTGDLNLGSNTLFAKDLSLEAEGVNWNFSNGNKIKLLSWNGSTEATGAPGRWHSGVSFMTHYVGFQLSSYGGDNEVLLFRKMQDNGVWHSWHYIYHEGFKPTKSDVGLGNVDNTADANKSVNYAATSGSANSVAWVNVSGKPTTLSGYGITDGVYSTQVSAIQTNITWFKDIISTNRRAFIYNSSGEEYSYLVGMESYTPDFPQYGSILKMGYVDKYLRILRRVSGAWLSNDWEKISAGFADSADKLQTARTIWGQSFDGTSNITGPFQYESVHISNLNEIWSTGSLWLQNGARTTGDVVIAHNNGGRVGIGTNSPAYKLHVNGDMATTGRVIVDSLQIGNITIIYDAANKGLRIAGGGLYADSYLSSLGVDASTALSVKKWADSIQITTENDGELATDYSIGNLYRMINSNQKSITESLNQSVGALQGRCTSLEQRVSALENKVNK
mgnify:CR=1 FL=1